MKESLKKPTMAERVVEEFRNAARTVSIATIAKRLGAEKEQCFGGKIVYHFDDGSTLITSGRGKAHKIEIGEGKKN